MSESGEYTADLCCAETELKSRVQTPGLDPTKWRYVVVNKAKLSFMVAKLKGYLGSRRNAHVVRAYGVIRGN